MMGPGMRFHVQKAVARWWPPRALDLDSHSIHDLPLLQLWMGLVMMHEGGWWCTDSDGGQARCQREDGSSKQ